MAGCSSRAVTQDDTSEYPQQLSTLILSRVSWSAPSKCATSTPVRAGERGARTIPKWAVEVPELHLPGNAAYREPGATAKSHATVRNGTAYFPSRCHLTKM